MAPCFRMRPRDHASYFSYSYSYIYQLCMTLFYQSHWLQHLSYVWENLGGKNLVTGVQEGPWGKYTWGGEALVKMRNSRKKRF